MRIRVVGYFILSMAASSCLIACSVVDENNSDQERELAVNKKIDNKDQTTEQNKTIERNKSNSPQISTSNPKISKPISESEGITEDQIHTEIHEVPNRFPLQERDKKQEQEEKDKEESQNKDGKSEAETKK